MENKNLELMILKTKQFDKETYEPMLGFTLVLVDTFNGAIKKLGPSWSLPVCDLPSLKESVSFYDDDPLRLPTTRNEDGPLMEQTSDLLKSANKTRQSERV